MRRVQVFKSEKGNSLSHWWAVKNPLVVIFNFLIVYSCRYLPSLALKRFLLRFTGIKIGRNASFGLGATFDIFFPELIEIGEDTVIGYNATVLCHEFLVDEWRTGKVKIGKRVMIGTNSTVLPGVEIGDGASISAMSLVNSDIRAGALAGGIPAREIKRKAKGAG